MPVAPPCPPRHCRRLARVWDGDLSDVRDKHFVKPDSGLKSGDCDLMATPCDTCMRAHLTGMGLWYDDVRNLVVSCADPSSMSKHTGGGRSLVLETAAGIREDILQDICLGKRLRPECTCHNTQTFSSPSGENPNARCEKMRPQFRASFLAVMAVVNPKHWGRDQSAAKKMFDHGKQENSGTPVTALTARTTENAPKQTTPMENASVSDYNRCTLRGFEPVSFASKDTAGAIELLNTSNPMLEETWPDFDLRDTVSQASSRPVISRALQSIAFKKNTCSKMKMALSNISIFVWAMRRAKKTQRATELCVENGSRRTWIDIDSLWVERGAFPSESAKHRVSQLIEDKKPTCIQGILSSLVFGIIALSDSMKNSGARALRTMRRGSKQNSSQKYPGSSSNNIYNIPSPIPAVSKVPERGSTRILQKIHSGIPFHMRSARRDLEEQVDRGSIPFGRI